MKNNTIENQRLTHEALASFIEKKDAAFKAKYSGQEVKKLCSLDMNTLDEDINILDFTGEMHKDYQSLVEANNEHLQGESILNHHRLRRNDHESVLKDFDEKIEQENAILTRKESELDEDAKHFRIPLKTWNWVLVALVILSFSETLINFKILSLLGGNIISSIATAILLSLGVFFYCHLAGPLIRKYGQNILWKKLLLFAAFFTPMAVLMYVLATIRMQYMEMMNLGSYMITSPVAFTFINSFVLGISLWLVYHYKPDSSWHKRYKEYLKDCAAIEQCKNNIETLKEKRTEELHAFGTECSNRYDILLLGERNEQDIANRYGNCYEALKMACLIRNSQTKKLFRNISTANLPTLSNYYTNYKNQMK